jgi:hypothetical protein
MIYHTINLDQVIHWDGISQVPNLLSKIDRDVGSGEPVTVIGGLLWESNYRENREFVLLMEEIKKRQLPVFLFLNFLLDKDKDNALVKKLVDMKIDIIYVDFFFWRVYQEIIVKKTNKTNPHWNSNADKFLFLTGKPNKINRIGLLWHFYKKDLLKHAIWSLYVQDNERETTLTFLKNQGVELDVANQFIDTHWCIPDNVNIIFSDGGSPHYGGIPYDESLYAKVKFRVVAETSFQYKNPFLTEKTWLTIVNRCPFIMAGDCGSLDYLESLGFKTFKKYLKVPDYDSLQNPLARLNAIVTNTSSWLTDLESSDEIHQDVEYNYNHFVQLGQAMATDLQQQIQNKGLQVPVTDVISTLDIVPVMLKQQKEIE